MLNRKTPDTLAHNITLGGQGVTAAELFLFNNIPLRVIREKAKELAETEQGKNDQEWVNRELFIMLVKEINGVKPTQESVQQMEDDNPDFITSVISEYHLIRRVEVVKN